MAKILSIEALAKRYPVRGGGKFVLFENLWLAAPRGEVTCIFGHPGCGKTTLLNILAGLDTPSEGVAILDGHEIAGPSLERALMTGEPALLPWRNLLGNVGYAVRAKWPAWPGARATAHAHRFIELAGLAGQEQKRVFELSPGLQHRAALARALSVEPKLLLMDEPFRALDAISRGELQDDLRRICRDTGQTVLIATHDVDEAIFLADRIVLMSNGPKAAFAGILENPLPAERRRAEIHRNPFFYALRNHIADFLASRSARFAEESKTHPYDPRYVPVVRPSLPEPSVAGGSDAWAETQRAAAIARVDAATRSVEEAKRMPGLRSMLNKARGESGE